MKLIKAKLPNIEGFHHDGETISRAQDNLAQGGTYYEQTPGEILKHLMSESQNITVYIDDSDENWYRVSTVHPRDLNSVFNDAIEEAEEELDEERGGR